MGEDNQVGSPSNALEEIIRKELLDVSKEKVEIKT